MKKIRVGAVSYLNTRPLIYGFRQGLMAESVELIEDYPSRIAGMLIEDTIDIGLIPVAAIPKLKEAYITGDYGIAADGEVASVCLFGDVPVEAVKEVLLDYQSRTSVQLARILLKEYWQTEPAFKKGGVDFRELIGGTTAGVVIGDRALQQRQSSKYIYDLGLAWKQYTGLPFVFAAWVSNKKLDPEFVRAFNHATSVGLQHIDAIVAANPCPYFDLNAYYTHYIHYSLDAVKRKGLALFLEKLTALEPLPH
jgi:chorismate dehydratase